MADQLDLLQAKIEKAKGNLPPEARRAIEAVGWRGVIFGMRIKKGYSIEQLGDLEIETELVLCGLLDPADYPKELEKRMHISRTQAEDLVDEMNELVFKKIRQELMKNSIGSKKYEEEIEVIKVTPAHPPLRSGAGGDNDILKQAGIEIMPNELVGPRKEQETNNALYISKLSDSFKIPAKRTEYTIGNISKDSEKTNGKKDKSKDKPSVSAVEVKPVTPVVPTTPAPAKADPYRMPIE